MNHQTRRYPSLSHWGAFTAVVRNSRCEPFALETPELLEDLELQA